MNRHFVPLWAAGLVAGSAALTAMYTCITPFAAFAVIGALTLSRGRALLLTLAVWAANQAVGFGLLAYPWTARTFAWGLALGAAAMIATLAAHWTVRRLDAHRAPIQTAAAFVSAFVLDQLALYAVAATVLGGTGAFVPAIVGRVLTINAVTLVGLVGLYRLAVAAEALVRRRRAHEAAARLA